ncbi:hypothetical protein FF38_11835 [Lucilia cuprina]|uniref:Uncharacterized protein n=1 Tax=Lucilia cuprina TaxID=7375 RepID=A0A0L0BYH5_LUCCU|nr:hypothetical protein FF38_11835 [Lucilia cuprina]
MRLYMGQIWADLREIAEYLSKRHLLIDTLKRQHFKENLDKIVVLKHLKNSTVLTLLKNIRASRVSSDSLDRILFPIYAAEEKQRSQSTLVGKTSINLALIVSFDFGTSKPRDINDFRSSEDVMKTEKGKPSTAVIRAIEAPSESSCKTLECTSTYISPNTVK